MRSLKLTILVLALLSAFFHQTPAFADYKRDYVIGKKSFEDGDYQDAIKNLKNAIAEQPESAERIKLYGTVFDSYLPHFYLGEAYFRLGDCDTAITHWNQASQIGVIQGVKEFAQMRANMGSCNSQVIDASGIAVLAAEEISNLETAISSFAELESEPLLASEWPSRWGPKLSQARQLVQSLTAQLETGRAEGDPDSIESVTSQAKSAAEGLLGDVRLANAQVEATREQNARDQQLAQERARQQERQARDAARSDLLNTIRLAKGTNRPSGGNSQMKSLLAEVDRMVSAGENLSSSASTANIREQSQNLKNVLRRYEVSVQNWQSEQQSIARRTPPPDLKQMAEAYFAGQYEQTVRLAQLDKFNENREKIQALLFRAAANHKLYVRSGEKAQAALRQAEEDIRSIKQLDSRFSPYIAAFSPSFLTLFRQTG